MTELEEARELTDGDNLYYRDSGKIRFFRVLKKQKRSVVVREVPIKKKGSGFVPHQEQHNFIGSSPTTLRLKGGEVFWKGVTGAAPGKKLTLWPRGRPIKEEADDLDEAAGHNEVLMEAHHVSDAIVESGPLTEKASVAVNAIQVIGKMKNQDIYRKIVGGEGYPAKKGLSGLSGDEKKELTKQLTKAAARVVAEGDMEQGEVKQTLAHIVDIFKRIRTKKSGAHYGRQREDIDDLFEAEVSGIDDLFEELTEDGSRFLARKYGLTGAEAKKLANHTNQKSIISKIEKWRSGAGVAASSPLARGKLLDMLKESLEEGYAKAGDEPQWDSMEAVFDKLMMDQDLSKEELVDVGKYLDMVTSSARGPWQNAPAKLPNPTVTAGPVTEDVGRFNPGEKHKTVAASQVKRGNRIVYKDDIRKVSKVKVGKLATEIYLADEPGMPTGVIIDLNNKKKIQVAEGFYQRPQDVTGSARGPWDNKEIHEPEPVTAGLAEEADQFFKLASEIEGDLLERRLTQFVFDMDTGEKIGPMSAANKKRTIKLQLMARKAKNRADENPTPANVTHAKKMQDSVKSVLSMRKKSAGMRSATAKLKKLTRRAKKSRKKPGYKMVFGRWVKEGTVFHPSTGVPLAEGEEYTLIEGFYQRPQDRQKQKENWMKLFAKVAKQSGLRGRINWDAAHHYYFQGMGAEDAGMRYGKSHVKNTAAV